jgi:hypothetical protein
MRTPTTAIAVAMAVASTTMAGIASAQQPTQPADAPAEGEAPIQKSTTPGTDAAAACVPECRSGYICHAGRCVSACNPPCAQGERCSDGECLPSSPPPPPTYAGTTGFGGPAEAPASMQPEPLADESANRHDGFMLRLTLGFGYGNLGQEATAPAALGGDSAESDAGGLAGTFSVDLGGAVSDSITIHARLSDLVIVDPDVTINGQDAGTAEDVSLAAFLLAPAITFYAMPANVYGTLAVGASWVRSDVNDREVDSSEVGLGLNVDVGKEWWVGDQWGLGIAGRFWLTATTETDTVTLPPTLGVAPESVEVETDVSVVGATVLFSATLQ